MNKTQLHKTQKKKQYEINKTRALIRKQTEANKETKLNERRQKRENTIDEDIHLCGIFEFATSNKIYVNVLNLCEIKSDSSSDYTGDFELVGSMLISEIELKKNK